MSVSRGGCVGVCCVRWPGAGSVFDGRLASNRKANHRDVNHLAAGMKPGQINPFFDPEAKLDKMLLKYAHDILDKTPEEVKLRTMGPSGA